MPAPAPDASEAMLYLLDEPKTELSPQVLAATHALILTSHPGVDILWPGEDGIEHRTSQTTSARFRNSI
jgi:predicted ATPase